MGVNAQGTPRTGGGKRKEVRWRKKRLIRCIEVYCEMTVDYDIEMETTSYSVRVWRIEGSKVEDISDDERVFYYWELATPCRTLDLPVFPPNLASWKHDDCSTTEEANSILTCRVRFKEGPMDCRWSYVEPARANEGKTVRF